MPRDPLCLPLNSDQASIHTVGGKGASLAIMANAGINVPRGFCVTTRAYRQFITSHGLDGRIAEILNELDPNDPQATQSASARIMALFADNDVCDTIATAVSEAYEPLSTGPVAVRSSATAEDLPQASFAGQMESYLNINGSDNVIAAVRSCWASLWTSRAIDYRAQNNIASSHVSCAVVVQELVDAQVSGVIFTANPVSGDASQLVINATWGLGESLVGGDVTPDNLVVDRRELQIRHRDIGDKAVASVSTSGGTTVRPLAGDKRRAAVLDDAQTTQLASLALRIEQLYGQAMDIEWAMRDNTVAIVQARPVTSIHGTQLREVWNDSLTGDYLWTSANLGEAVPSVMTPATWSLVRRTLAEAMGAADLDHHQQCGNIGGRLYLNYSHLISTAEAMGMGKIMAQAAPMTFGTIPPEVSLPKLPMGRWQIIKRALPKALAFNKSVKQYQKHLYQHVSDYREHCDTTFRAISQASSNIDLLTLWKDHCGQLTVDGPRLLAAGARVNGMSLAKIGSWLRRYVNDADANALISGSHQADHTLASLGPLVGLQQLHNGEIDRDTFATTWGHRCPDELELSAPRPGEDPAWIQRLMTELAAAPDLDVLVAKQQANRDAAFERFSAQHPSKVAQLKKRTRRVAQALRARETTRSESVRCVWVVRHWLLRVSEVTGIGEDVFFLTLDETQQLLNGDRSVLDTVEVRRNAYRHYCSLPTYPTLIRGHFEPETWATDPNRRGDIFDASQQVAPLSSVAVRGAAGSSGTAEGTARVLSGPDESHRVDIGDILVTSVTNVGWTPIFPRVAAVVTDVGASLSHAAIVARELAIPAVIGCGTATAVISDGDLIRVDGDAGTVEILTKADQRTSR